MPPDQNNKNDLGDVLKSVLGLVVVVAFLLSPLGSFVLSILNGFLLLSILAPIMAVVGFQIWEYFNTISGPCPNCGIPVKVLKRKGGSDQDDVPSLCFNCGTILQASDDNQDIIISLRTRRRNNIMDDWDGIMGGSDSGSMFDTLFGAPRMSSRRTVTKRTTITEDGPTSSRNRRREQTIIDVEVDPIDDNRRPFQ